MGNRRIATRRNARYRLRKMKGRAMAKHRRRGIAAGIALASHRWAQFDDLKHGILLLLGAWIAYFVLVELFIHTLNRITVPVMGIPLSALLAAQGCAFLFLGALYVLARRRRGPA
jgi:putative solute:sodium symporter small subunit